VVNRTSIQWCDFSANPLKYRTADGRVVWACEKVSAGCTNCYAEHLSTRYGGARRAGDWNAATMKTLTPFLDEKELRAMLTSKAISGKRVFVGDMTDVFGEWVERWMLAQLIGAMALRYDVTWQVLTKRADRMRELLCDEGFRAEIYEWVEMLAMGDDGCDPLARTTDDLRANAPDVTGDDWPIVNLWLGVSSEDQQRANERIPLLLQTPAAVRFVSAEPLIGPIDLSQFTFESCCGNASAGDYLNGEGPQCCGDPFPPLDWIIVGGESGHSARECDVNWIRSIVQQCAQGSVPCFVKQLGAKPFCEVAKVDVTPHADFGDEVVRYVEPQRVALRDRKGGDITEFPTDLRVRQFPRNAEDERRISQAIEEGRAW
jgi:protein gp37